MQATPPAVDPEVELVAAHHYLVGVGATGAETDAVFRAAAQILAYERWEVRTRCAKGRGFAGTLGRTTADAVLDAVCSISERPRRWCALAQAAISVANAERGCRAMSAHLRGPVEATGQIGQFDRARAQVGQPSLESGRCAFRPRGEADQCAALERPRELAHHDAR